MEGTEETTRLEAMQKDWWLFLMLGFGLVILGALAITTPFVMAVTLQILFGWLFVIGAILRTVHALRMRKSKSVVLGLLIAVLYLMGGLILLAYPIQGVVGLTLVIAVLFMAGGVVKIFEAIDFRGMPNWGWQLAGGILTLVLGFLIWTGWPVSSLWAIGLLVGIDLVYMGWTMIALGAMVHAAAGATRAHLAGEH